MPTVEVGEACAIALAEACAAFNDPNALASEPCVVVLCPAASVAPIPREVLPLMAP